MPHRSDYQNLISLGISPYIIKEAGISPDLYARLYNHLKNYFDPELKEPLQINEPWQLQLLCKKIDVLPHLDISQAIDNLGANIAHYLASADCIEGLEWIKNNHPNLLSAIDNGGNSIAHSAAYAGSLNTLQWIKKNIPSLLIRENLFNETLAHIAAKGGQVGVLNWLKSIKYSLFSFEDKDGLTIVHIALGFNQPDILNWIKANYPKLLLSIINGFSIAHYAVFYKQLSMLDWIRDNKPELLPTVTSKGENIAHIAAQDGFAEGLAWIHAHLPHLLDAVESNTGKNIAHLAAEHGQLNTLKEIADNRFDLMNALDYNSQTVCQAAVKSSNNDVLKWLDKISVSITEEDNNGLTLVHIASQHATVEKLAWLETVYLYNFFWKTTHEGKTVAHTAISNPAALAILDWIEFTDATQLWQKDNHGLSIAHQATIHKRLDVLRWIKKLNNSHVLFNQTKSKLTVKDYAARTGDPQFLNEVILLSPDPKVFHVVDSGNLNNPIVQSLLKALEINFTLTDVTLPPGIDNGIEEAIRKKVERNQLIAKATREFAILAESYLDKINPAPLPIDLLFEIFKKHLPENIPDKEITRVFNRIINNLSVESLPKIRQKAAIAFVKKEISDTLTADAQLTSINYTFIRFNLLNSSESKVNALKEIQQIIESEYDSFEVIQQNLIDFYQTNKIVFEDVLYKGPFFFKPQQEKSLHQIVRHLCSIMNISSLDARIQEACANANAK